MNPRPTGRIQGKDLVLTRSFRAPIDDVFDRVTVNDPDPALRANRLRLLSTIRATLTAVADFSKIEAKAEA